MEGGEYGTGSCGLSQNNTSPLDKVSQNLLFLPPLFYITGSSENIIFKDS